MGIRTNEGSGKPPVFFGINAKEGCFQQGSGANKKVYPQMTDLEGTVVAFKIEESEYEGVKREELRLLMNDIEPGEPRQYVSFTITTGGEAGSFALKLLAKLNAVDLTKPITLRPWKMAAGEKMADGSNASKDLTGVVVYQDGKKVTEDFGDGVTKLPDLPKVKVGAKEVVDKSPWTPILDGLLNSLHGKLNPADGEAHAQDEVDVNDAAGAAEAAANQPSQRARA